VSAATRETDDAGPEANAALRDDLDRVAQAMSELTDDQREVIELRFFAGLSVLETAVAMGRQEGTVRGLQFRAIASLRRTLGIEGAAAASSGSPAAAVAAATLQVLR
jgi:RNA polymerase sigma-70 factor (ECF subfamily)